MVFDDEGVFVCKDRAGPKCIVSEMKTGKCRMTSDLVVCNRGRNHCGKNMGAELAPNAEDCTK
jgi:hypothetical protein